MMETKSMGKTLVKVFGILAVIAAIVLAAYTLITLNIKQANVGGIIMDSLVILSLISIAVYCAFGFTKKAALFYKLFIGVFAIAKLVNIYGLSYGHYEAVVVLTECIIFGMLCILGFATDLGKTKSLIFGVIAVLASVAEMIICAINNPQAFLGAFPCVANTVICAVLLLMILAKYYDKAERGSK